VITGVSLGHPVLKVDGFDERQDICPLGCRHSTVLNRLAAFLTSTGTVAVDASAYGARNALTFTQVVVPAGLAVTVDQGTLAAATCLPVTTTLALVVGVAGAAPIVFDVPLDPSTVNGARAI
jgi:hypothetical protein